MSKSAARLALVCALVGLAASIAAAYIHYHLLFDPSYTSFCDVNATVSCTQVYLSRYSTFRGIPVAVFGAIWFAGALLLSIMGLVGSESTRENAPGYLFAASTLALAVVLYFEYEEPRRADDRMDLLESADADARAREAGRARRRTGDRLRREVKAAELLGMSFRSFRYYVKKYNLR